MCELTFDKEVRSFEKNFPERRYSIPLVDEYDEFEWVEIDAFHGRQQWKDQEKRTKAVSMPPDTKELQEIFKEVQLHEKQMQELNAGLVKKANFNLKRLLFKNAYFERLFPSIKEQKPGQDLYAITASF